MKRPARQVFALIASCALAAPAFADRPADKPGKPDKAAGKGGGDGVSLSVDLVFGGLTAPEARRLAVEHGATGYKPLPPGIRKNLARGKPMPPGIAKTRAPGAMLGALPHHEGYEWRVAGTDLLLVQLGTALVAEVLVDVFD